MSAIYQEIVLAWDGKEYTVKPSYRMVQSIEAQGVSIIGTVHRMGRGEPPMSHVAFIVSHMLRSAGARKATPERVYAHLVGKADVAEIERIAEAIVAAFIPVEPEAEASEGNVPAPAADEKDPRGESPQT